ncbi:MAG: membrane integrity-associated transporter subunit PqiC [Deltaproteobacteria bacterium]|nr:membrane integrity-associated transporter subunit PqiC [Deltaproteobacteria bacterium]
MKSNPPTPRPSTTGQDISGPELAITAWKKLLRTLAGLAIALAPIAACGGKVPDTRFYQLSAPATAAPPGDLVIALDAFDTDAGYDDERMVYRATPYRIDYYQYHRWSAAPGTIVGNFLELALERSGEFRQVTREASDRSPVVLRGRVLAIEEVDTSPTRWLARIVLELTLTDSKTGEALWSEQFEETQQMRVQKPEGLAEALSIAMARIAKRATPSIADHARKHAQTAATTATAHGAR